MLMINETHDVNLTSWVSSANGDSDFPIQNLPFAIFKMRVAKAFPGILNFQLFPKGVFFLRTPCIFGRGGQLWGTLF